MFIELNQQFIILQIVLLIIPKKSPVFPAFHVAGTFEQNVNSGSMAYYNATQGSDNSTYTRTDAGDLTVNFTGETRRLQIDDDLLSGSYSEGTAWDTTFGLNNLGNTDLQIKPGFLVRPGGTYEYWLADPDATEDYKFCAFAFERNRTGNQPNITLTLSGNTSLVQWTDTTSNDAIAVLLIPESRMGEDSSQAGGIDPKAPETTIIAASTTGTNPFSRSLQIVQNTNTGGSSNPFVIDFPGTVSLPYQLDTTYTKFVLLIRYKGDPTPLTNFTLSIL